jgi:hypothetical protein
VRPERRSRPGLGVAQIVHAQSPGTAASHDCLNSSA